MLCGNIFAETLTVDFEEDTENYTAWEFTNFVTKQTNSGVAAHGGSYFGTTGGKTTGALTTKEAIANPQSITFFISKTSTNTTASSWLVQVSSDNEEWTTVGDEQSAGANITKGQWTEVSRDLSNYTNVYVRIAYSGTTAVRAIDDVTLTYGAAAPSDKTATTVELSGEYAKVGEVGATLALPTATVKAGDATVEGATVTWTSSNTTVATIDGNNINLLAAGETTIKATYAGDDTYEASNGSYILTVTAPTQAYTSIAAMLADITPTKTDATYQFENLLVTYVKNSNTYVSDGQNGFLLYGSNLGLEEGNTYTGSVTGQIYTYNGLPEMALNAQGVSATVVTEGNLVAWPAIAPAELQSYINIPVTIEDAVFVSASSKNLTFKVGDADLSVYNNWNVDVASLEADKTYTLKGVGSVYSKNDATTYQLYLASFEEKTAEPVASFRDIKADLTSTALLPEGAEQWNDVSTGIAVAEDGTLSRVATDAENAAAIFNGNWHGTQYGWANFTATVPVVGCVKITLGGSNYGNGEMIVTNAEGKEVAKIDHHIGAMWSASTPENVAVGYYRTNEPTTLNFSKADYLPYFAVEAIAEADLPAEVTTYNVTFEAGEGTGTAPKSKEVEVGAKVVVPANTTLFVEGKTLTAWTDGTNEYKAGDEITVNDNIILTPVFTENATSLSDRTAETTIVWQFGEANGVGTLNAEGKSTILVTQATIGDAVIDVKMDIDATSGKINNVGRGDKWAQCNDGTKLTIPAYTGTAVSFDSFSDGAGTTIGGVEATDKAATYEGTASTLDIVAKGMGYIASVTAVYPVPATEPEPEPTETTLYTWAGGATAEDVVETGGTAVASDGQSVNYANSTYFTIRLNGAKDFSSATVTVTLDNELKAGDKINITAYRNKNAADKQTGALLKFEKGEATVSTATTGLEFVNIDQSDESAADSNRGTEPNTVTLTVPADADGSKTITMTRAITGTNLFITKLEITGERTSEPGPEPQPSTFVDIKADFMNGSFFTANDTEVTSAGLKMNEDGSFTRVAADAEDANAVITGKYHSNEHGISNFSASVKVDTPVRITFGTCAWGGDVTVTGGTEEVSPMNTNTGECYHNNKTANVVSTYYLGGEATLTIAGGSYVPYFAVEKLTQDEIDALKSKFTLTYYDTDGTTVLGTQEVQGQQEIGTFAYTAADVTVAEGKAFRGWFEKANGGKKYQTTDKVGSDLSLYAIATDIEVAKPGASFVYDLTNKYFDFDDHEVVETEGTGYWHDGTHGWAFHNGDVIKVQVAGDATITASICQYGATDGVYNVTDAAGNVVGELAAYSKAQTDGETVSYTYEGEATTLSLTLASGGENYLHSLVVANKASQEPTETPDPAENLATTATFPFNLGTEGQVATFGNEAAYYLTSKVTHGDNLVLKDQNSGQTRFQPNEQINDADKEVNDIFFMIRPKKGITFTPTKAAFKTTRFGTDGGKLNIYWVAPDGTKTQLDKEVSPARNNANPNVTEWEKAIENVEGAEGSCGLLINLYSLGNTKQVGFADIVITGILNGEVIEVPMLKTVTVNNTVYNADDIFEVDGDNYAATVEVSKTATMVSAENPVTAETLTGEVGEITYDGNDTQCKVTIPTVLNNITVNYVLNVVQKPDFTLTYFDADGTTEIGKQTVEKDAQIGEFAYGADKVTVAEGKAFRGWAKAISGSKNRKFTVEDAITGDTKLYALVTEIEEATQTARYDYDLRDEFFYMEDHEMITANGGSWHDAQHGWVFGANDKVELAMGGNGYIKLGLCQYSGSGNITLSNGETVVGTVEAKAGVDGAETAINYEGEAATLTLSFAGTTYIHGISIVNLAEAPFDAAAENFEVVAAYDTDDPAQDAIENGKNFITTLELVNSTEGDERIVIYLPNGTYDLGEKVLTTISRNNVSIVGETMDGVIIKNAPSRDIEGIGTTATLLNTSTGLYLQDITLQNALDYYGAVSAGQAGGRAVCLQDKGKFTVCKNVKMLSYQDTYYSNSASQFYWEDSEIHGTVDYLCGDGDVFYNRVKLVNESRSATGKVGDDTVCAPYTSENCVFGYVFNECTIENLSATFNLGRSWGGNSSAVYINTTLNQPNEIDMTRFTTGGMNIAAYNFKEYNTMDADGNVVSPASNILEFTHSSGNKKYETILTAEEAAGYAYDKVFTTWDPAAKTIQLLAEGVAFDGTTLSWNAVDGARLYAVCADGSVVAFTEQTSYDTTSLFANEAKAEDEAEIVWSVRTVNAQGGLGLPMSKDGIVDGINKTTTTVGTVANGQYYNLQGQRVSNPTKGIYIVDGKKVVVK